MHGVRDARHGRFNDHACDLAARPARSACDSRADWRCEAARQVVVEAFHQGPADALHDAAGHLALDRDDNLAGILRPFTWKESGDASYGLSAQEAFEILPSMVTPGSGEPEEADFQAWGVDQLKAVPYLIAYCKRLEERIQEMEG